MKSINPEWLEVIKDTVINSCPYFQLQQMVIKKIDWGSSHLEIPLEKRHMQPFGVVHGGVFASLLDAAGFWAVFSKVHPSKGMTTVELKINFLAPARRGLLIGHGKCIKLGKTLGLGEARIENEKGKLLAHATTTVMILKELELPEILKTIPKFR